MALIEKTTIATIFGKLKKVVIVCITLLIVVIGGISAFKYYNDTKIYKAIKKGGIKIIDGSAPLLYRGTGLYYIDDTYGSKVDVTYYIENSSLMRLNGTAHFIVTVVGQNDRKKLRVKKQDYLYVDPGEIKKESFNVVIPPSYRKNIVSFVVSLEGVDVGLAGYVKLDSPETLIWIAYKSGPFDDLIPKDKTKKSN